MKLEDLRKLAEARTKGKWRSLPKTLDSVAKEHHIVGVHAPDCKIYHERLAPECIRETHERQRADSVFIAAFANHADALLDVVAVAQVVQDRGCSQNCACCMNMNDDCDCGYVAACDALAKLEAIK